MVVVVGGKGRGGLMCRGNIVGFIEMDEWTRVIFHDSDSETGGRKVGGNYKKILFSR